MHFYVFWKLYIVLGLSALHIFFFLTKKYVFLWQKSLNPLAIYLLVLLQY